MVFKINYFYDDNFHVLYIHNSFSALLYSSLCCPILAARTISFINNFTHISRLRLYRRFTRFMSLSQNESLIRLFYSVLFHSTGTHVSPWHPFTLQANHTFVTYFRLRLYACIEFFLTSCRLMQCLPSVGIWEHEISRIVLRLIWFFGVFFFEKSDFLTKF